MRGYYFITDHQLSLAGNLNDVKSAVAAGVSVIQYRRKEASTCAMETEAGELRRLCPKEVQFLVNDRVDIALAVDADGVHIGQDDLSYETARRLLGKDKIIGVTVHSLAEAEEAQEMGADYLGVSPIFITQTKLDAGKPAGIVLIEQIKRVARIPIVAIGGINLKNAPEVIQAGADSLCAIAAVITKPDVQVEIAKFQALFPYRAV